MWEGKYALRGTGMEQEKKNYNMYSSWIKYGVVLNSGAYD